MVFKLKNLLDFVCENILGYFLFQYEYKKSFKQSKGFYHFTPDTAEQIHHTENAVLQSQVYAIINISCKEKNAAF